MEIRIHIQRPLLTIGLVVGVLLLWNGVIGVKLPWTTSANLTGDEAGGIRASAVLASAVQDIDRERVKQAVLNKREEILRYQLSLLEEEALREQTPEKIRELAETRAVLLGIIKERSNSEQLLKLSLEQLWEAEGTAYTTRDMQIATEIDWPVFPALGISAHFDDVGYKKRFGFDHRAVDIPVAQNSPIRAPADGTVLKVSENGLGYSYVVLDHGGDLQTIYGHVSVVLVSEGETVSYGKVIARSGGQPGTLGSGLLTTGPHLHFAMKSKGALVDPLKYLPELP